MRRLWKRLLRSLNAQLMRQSLHSKLLQSITCCSPSQLTQGLGHTSICSGSHTCEPRRPIHRLAASKAAVCWNRNLCSTVVNFLPTNNAVERRLGCTSSRSHSVPNTPFPHRCRKSGAVHHLLPLTFPMEGVWTNLLMLLQWGKTTPLQTTLGGRSGRGPAHRYI